MSDSLRDALEDAYEEEDAPEDTESTQDASESAQSASESTQNASESTQDAAESTQDASESTQAANTDTTATAETDLAKPDETKSKAPQSWTPAAREHWDKIPPAAQAQITKRDNEVMTVMKEASQYKNFSEGFNRMVQPFQGMFQAQGTSAMQGIQNVLQMAARLQGGNTVQKAQTAAQLIMDFGVDISALDDLLVGNAPRNDPTDQIQKMQQQLDQQNRYLQTQQNQTQQRQSRNAKIINTETDEFLKANEFAPDLRGIMADFMDMAERQGQRLTLKQAYQRAIGTRPDIQQILAGRVDSKSNAAALSGARKAGVSVAQQSSMKGAGSGSMSLRETIADAWES